MQFIILGCGSSMGVPRPDGFFGNCDPKNKKNYRTRCSALIKTSEENILIDTSPDLRHQLLRHKINKINKVYYSHMHADQTHGINDLRSFFINSKKQINIFADDMTTKYLKKSFSYCFFGKPEYPAILKFKKFKQNISFKDKHEIIKIKSIEVKHGGINCLAFIINNKCAYASDVSKFHEKDFKYLINLKYLVIDCLRLLPHPSHFNLDEALKVINKLKPKKAILTNMHSDLDYNYLLKILPKNVKPAYDGLSFYI